MAEFPEQESFWYSYVTGWLAIGFVISGLFVIDGLVELSWQVLAIGLASTGLCLYLFRLRRSDSG